MQTNEQRHAIRIVLDDVTCARLIELADICNCEPSQIAYSLLKDILEDDALAHELPEDFPTITRQ